MKRRHFIQAGLGAAGLAHFSQLVASEREYQQPQEGVAPALPRDHGPHPDYKTEWWYFTGWFTSPELPEPFGLQITFFRSAPNVDLANLSRFSPSQLILAHAAVALPEKGKLIHADVIQRHDGLGSRLEGMSMGNSDSLLNIVLPGWQLVAQTNEEWVCNISTRELRLNLSIRPSQAPWLQGSNGYSRKGPKPEHSSYYVTQPHMQATGKIAIEGKTYPVSGSFWMDHEWSSTVLADNAQGWDWVGLHGNDGSALMAFQIRPRTTGKPPVWTHAALRNKAGEVRQFTEVRFETLKSWTSPRTAITYPIAQRLHLDELSFVLSPLLPDQELDARASSGTLYWEGAVTVQSDNREWGKGYLEMTGYDRPMSL